MVSVHCTSLLDLVIIMMTSCFDTDLAWQMKLIKLPFEKCKICEWTHGKLLESIFPHQWLRCAPRISLPTVVASYQCLRECHFLHLLKSRCSTSHQPITEPFIVPLLIRFIRFNRAPWNSLWGYHSLTLGKKPPIYINCIALSPHPSNNDYNFGFFVRKQPNY